MLNENQPDPRKTLVCSDLQTYFQSLTDDTEYDLINFDVLLHHILTPQSFRESRRMQQDVLNQSATRLSSDGYLSIREIAYTSIAPLPRHATHKFLWFCTTRHLPGPARRMMHSMGMHSQGAGVCFFHADDLRQMLATSGLSISQWKTHQLARVGWKYHLALAGNATDLYIIAGRNAAPAN